MPNLSNAGDESQMSMQAPRSSEEMMVRMSVHHPNFFILLCHQ